MSAEDDVHRDGDIPGPSQVPSAKAPATVATSGVLFGMISMDGSDFTSFKVDISNMDKSDLLKALKHDDIFIIALKDVDLSKSQVWILRDPAASKKLAADRSNAALLEEDTHINELVGEGKPATVKPGTNYAYVVVVTSPSPTGRSAASSIAEEERGDSVGQLPLIQQPKRKANGPASGFAPSVSGKNTDTLDYFMGNSCASVYWPPGTVNDVLTQIMASRLHPKWANNAHHAVEAHQLLPRCLETVLENSQDTAIMDIQKIFTQSLGFWWPLQTFQILESGPTYEALTTRTRETFCGGEVVFATAAVPDFQATTKVKLRSGRLQEICVCGGELKNSICATFEGLPQAEIAAVSAVLTLRDLGLAPKDCVVPFFVHTGLHEQHGVAYVLDDSFPCVTLTSRVLSPMVAEDRELIVRFRAAAVTMAASTSAKLASATPVGGFTLNESRDDWGAFNPNLYHIKHQFVDSLFGSLQTSINHMLNVFSALMRERYLLRHVVFPVAILMQVPASADGCSMEKRPALVFDRILGITFHELLTSSKYASVRANALAQLREVLCVLHMQGVVHMDLYPGNIMLQDVRESEALGTVKLIDFDAAMFIGRLVPPIAKDILQRNGQLGIYHPDVFAEDAVVDVRYDWWLYAMMEAGAPFGVDRKLMEDWKLSHQIHLLARVEELIEQEKSWSETFKSAETLGTLKLP